jgi:hypothetical protein
VFRRPARSEPQVTYLLGFMDLEIGVQTLILSTSKSSKRTKNQWKKYLYNRTTPCSKVKIALLSEKATQERDNEIKWEKEQVRTGQRERQSKTSGYEWAGGHHLLAPTMLASHNRLGLQQTEYLSSSGRICTSPAHNPIQNKRKHPSLFS